MVTEHKTAPKCGAITRKGAPCSFKAVVDGRCKRHATVVARGQEGSARGLYGRALDDGERAAWASIPVGDLDDEIKVLKVRLARALNDQKSDGLSRMLQTLATLERTRMALAQDQNEEPTNEDQMEPKERAKRLLALVKSANAKTKP